MDKQKKLKELGERVRQVRAKEGLSMERLGKQIKKRYQLIQRLETGGTNPSMYYLRQIAEGLGVTLDELLNGL